MLPGTGTTELSRSPSKISPGPPKWRNQRSNALPAAGFAAANKVRGNNQVSLRLNATNPCAADMSLFSIGEHGDTRIAVENAQKHHRLPDGNRLLAFAICVPARWVTEMGKEGVYTRLRFR